MTVELGQIDVVQVIHADGTTGTAKLRVIGVAKNASSEPPAEPVTPVADTPDPQIEE